MTKIYVIEIDESDAFGSYTRTYGKCFSTYELAKEFLLVNFICQSNSLGEYFTLKDNDYRSCEFEYGASAVIVEIELVK